jgi:hypothetical protein
MRLSSISNDWNYESMLNYGVKINVFWYEMVKNLCMGIFNIQWWLFYDNRSIWVSDMVFGIALIIRIIV